MTFLATFEHLVINPIHYFKNEQGKYTEAASAGILLITLRGLSEFMALWLITGWDSFLGSTGLIGVGLLMLLHIHLWSLIKTGILALFSETVHNLPPGHLYALYASSSAPFLLLTPAVLFLEGLATIIPDGVANQIVVALTLLVWVGLGVWSLVRRNQLFTIQRFGLSHQAWLAFLGGKILEVMAILVVLALASVVVGLTFGLIQEHLLNQSISNLLSF